MTTQIITKKLSKQFHAPASNITFGDMRSQMATDLMKSLTEVIEKKAGYQSVYYILVHTKIDPAFKDGHVIKERLIILPDIPDTKYIGTILVKVDNKNADAEIVWNLPLDIPGPAFIDTEAGKRGSVKPGEKSIMDSAEGLPIFNRKLN